MSIFEDTDAINAFLAQLADQEIVEPMVEPIDEDGIHPLEFADVTGLFDEMYSEPVEALDSDGNPWYLT